jgi:hypothetical protein
MEEVFSLGRRNVSLLVGRGGMKIEEREVSASLLSFSFSCDARAIIEVTDKVFLSTP